MFFRNFFGHRPRKGPGRPRSLATVIRPRLESCEVRLLPSVFTVVDLGDAGSGSRLEGDLRYAVTQANANGDLSNHIQFNPGLTGTIVLTHGSLDITKDLEIDGPGQDLLTVSGDQSSGVFNITADPRVHNVGLADLTIANGTGILGPVVRGGGIYNDHAALTLTRVTVSGNVIPDRGQGGAIYNGSGALTLDATTIADNQGGDGAQGGGIYNDSGRLTITSSVLTGNSLGGSAKGGGIYNGSGTVSLTSSTLLDSTIGPGTLAARAVGGGIYNDSGTLTVGTSTLTGSSAGLNATGGGIYNQTGTVTVSGSTLAHNATGTNGSGGGIGGGLGVVIVDHSTISENTGGGINTNSFLQVTDSTVADNVRGPGINNWRLLIERSTISGNFNPGGVAGGIEQNRFPSTGVIDNSTISGNTALIGGGVFLGRAGEGLAITQCTIVGNHATGTSGTLAGGGGIHIESPAEGAGSLFIGHSVVAGNDTADPVTGADVDGPVVSMGSNFIGDGDFSGGWSTTSPDDRLRDHLGTPANPLDPLLGPLQDNGGPTLTRAPLPGSPLIFLDVPFGRDQRGSFRFIGAPGAVAVNPATAFRVDAPSVVAPGQPFQITVTALDQWDNTASIYHGTVHFSSTDLDAQLPDDYTFGTADGGAHTFDAALQTAGPQTILIQDTSAASLAVALNLVVEDGPDPWPPEWGSVHQLQAPRSFLAREVSHVW
jgi:hypothetical protein